MVHTSGTPPLTLFFGPGKNRVKGKPEEYFSNKTPKQGNLQIQSPLFPKFLLV